MREIKFRIWDKKMNKMIYPNDPVSGEILIYPLWVINLDGTVLDEDYFKLNDVVLMQYTGLKDKNGREIYEGDIVEIEGFKEHMEVFFKDGYFGWGKQHYGMYSFDPFGLEKLRVIGNIYEGIKLNKGDRDG